VDEGTTFKTFAHYSQQNTSQNSTSHISLSKAYGTFARLLSEILHHNNSISIKNKNYPKTNMLTAE
jgi:hypothetical protein